MRPARATTALPVRSAVAAIAAPRRDVFTMSFALGSGCQHDLEDLTAVLGRDRLVDLRHGHRGDQLVERELA
jgi:hypothetical protein